jgi:hypothetical protein
MPGLDVRIQRRDPEHCLRQVVIGAGGTAACSTNCIRRYPMPDRNKQDRDQHQGGGQERTQQDRDAQKGGQQGGQEGSPRPGQPGQQEQGWQKEGGQGGQQQGGQQGGQQERGFEQGRGGQNR